MAHKFDYKKLDGKRAKIISCIHYHKFGIGQEVTLSYTESCIDDIVGIADNGTTWFLTEEEFELIDAIPLNSLGDDLTSIAYNVAINWNHSELGCLSPLSRQMTTGLQEALDKLVNYFKTQKANNESK